MKSILNNILIAILLLTVASCNNNFLNENLDMPVVPAGESTIYISPEWESADYQFSLPGMGNADFKIEAAPSWLQISNTTGTLVNSVANIRCSAVKTSNFDKVGIYLDKIEVSAGKQTFYIPVGYLTEGDPAAQVEREITLYAYDYFNLQIFNTGEGLLIWDIVSLPDWLDIDMDRFNDMNLTGAIVSPYSHANLPFILNWDKFSAEDLKGRIILKTNDKQNPEVEIDITINLGNPEISVWLNNNSIDLGAMLTSYPFLINAWGSGILVWHFEELPEWLTITPAKGIYNTHSNYEDIIFTCNRSKLKPGVNSSVIYLKSNASNNPSIAINVIARAPGDNANIRDLGENIVDATFDKNTNTLYYVTSAPNKLVAYNAAQRTALYEIPLSKAPTCLAISEDYTKATVGHGGQISIVNLSNKTKTNFEVNGTLFDIAWGADDWFCYTIANHELHWVNAANLSTYVSPDNDLYSNDIIKKLPGYPYIIASRQGVSPSGFIVYSASTKNLKSYSHRDLKNFWFSQDGQYIFSQNQEIYRASNVIESNDTFDAPFNVIGRFNGAPIDNEYIKWIEHSSSSRTIWVISNYLQSTIYQYDDNDFAYQKSFYYSDVYQPDSQSTYEVEAQYLFSNKEGTELSVLRKGINNNKWSVEFVRVGT